MFFQSIVSPPVLKKYTISTANLYPRSSSDQLIRIERVMSSVVRLVYLHVHVSFEAADNVLVKIEFGWS